MAPDPIKINLKIILNVALRAPLTYPFFFSLFLYFSKFGHNQFHGYIAMSLVGRLPNYLGSWEFHQLLSVKEIKVPCKLMRLLNEF